MNFPTNEQFDKAATEAIKFRELPLGIYRINKAKSVETKFGENMILSLCNGQEDFTVWAPTRLVKELENEDYNFLRYNGMKKK